MIDAQEAQKLSAAYWSPVYLQVAEDRIRDHAKRGLGSVAHPFYGAENYPKEADKQAVFARLRERGFTVTEHKVPPSSDPREADWDEVSW